MSLTYNMNKTMSQAIKSNVNSTSSLLALFYLANPDAKEPEIKEFAEKNNLNILEVKKYFSESKQEDSIYENILSLKYGVKHFKPEVDELQNYVNKISSGTIDISPIEMDDYIEIISESIPKKTKRPEFHIINNLKNSEKSDKNEKYLQNSITENSQFLYSSIISQNPTPQSSFISKIEEPKQVAGIISSIKKENKIEIRLELSMALNEITNPNCLLRFLQLNGTTHLGYWIDDYKDEIECKESVDPRVYEILSNILNFCDKLPISVHDLKISKIGKKINKLGKSISSERPIKYKCQELVDRWKKMIENLKDKKRTYDYDKIDKDFKYYKETSDDRTTPDILSPKKQNSSYRDNNSMLRKTQRTEIESANDKNYKKVRIQDNEGLDSSSANFKSIAVNNDMLAANANIYNKNFSANSSNQINIGNYNNTSSLRNNLPANLPPFNMNANGGNINFKIQNIQIKNSNNSSNNKVTFKGILKKTEKLSLKEKKQKVRFELEERLERVKIFKLTDEVQAPAVTEEEYQKIQIEILKNPNYKFLNDLRSREINMEKENLSKAREKNKITKDILYKMIPNMPWTRPYELYISSNHHNDSYNENNDDDYNVFSVKGSESEEKNIINLLCQKILSVTYFRDSEIPDCPQMGSSKLFSFTDENIPKLENSKKVYNPDKPNPNADIFQYIDNLSESKLTPEIINTISQKIQNNHFTQEEKTKILDYLKRHLNKDLSQQPVSSQQFTAPTPFLKNYVPQMNASNTLNPINMNMNNAYNFNTAVNMPSLPIINPLNNKINSSGGTIPVMNYHDKNLIGKQFENREQKINMNFNTNKIFTKPCRNYHGPNGCIRGDNCHFIHDSTFQGREIPNFNLNNYRNYGHNSEKKYLITNVNIVNNYGNVSEEKEKDEINEVTVMKETSLENKTNESMVTPVVSSNGSSVMMNMNSNYINHKHYPNNFNRGNKMMMHGYQMNSQINQQINPQMNPQLNPQINQQLNSQMNNIRPQFMNNMNLKNSIPGGMGNIIPMHNINNMQMKMNMNIPNMNNMPNIGTIHQNPSNIPSSQNNTQNMNNNSNHSNLMNIHPNLYMYMNNYGRMPFNMIPPQNQSNKNN